ncbi:hypothetical protein BAU08_09435 [Bordetella bronchialis]|uniref:Uncharacterized protein n=2 Tax=Bordetella bronchialis TaxID=463025 RepID=A0A193FW01_9BORD|nr:hypothetical protein BAU08_09435 [Bordetella bronchialis]
MERRVKALEDAMIQVKQDLAVIRSNYATQANVEAVKSSVAEAKSAIIMWVVGAIFLAQVLPHLPEVLRAVGWLK